MNMEILILAAVAVFVLFRLFSVLGKQKGAPPPDFRPQSRDERPQPVLVHSDNDERQDDEDDFDDASGLEKIARVDPSFNQRDFLAGAKSAYEMIVRAFEAGDRTTLSSLLTEDVYRDYEAAIDAREKSGEAAPDFERIRDAQIEGGELNGSVAEVSVMFSAELATEERIMATREIWTFERDTQSRDPNWRLADVSAA